LVLPTLSSFAALISGFGIGDMIDLGGSAYSSAGEARSFAQATGSGTLRVSSGGKTASLTLLGSLHHQQLHAGR
jgi:hypothetical protein